MTFRWWERWGVLSGALAIVCWVVAFTLVSSPDTNDPDAKISAYYTSNSHQTRNMVAYLVFLAGVLLLVGFLSALRGRLMAAEGGAGRLTALAYGGGVASAVLWIVAVSTFSAPAFAADDTGKFHLDPNTFRFSQDLGYEFWVAAVVVAALTVWATSAIAMRSGLLPKWFAWIGILAGILQLFAVFFLPAFIFWGWVLVASLLLAWRPATVRTAAPPPPAV